MKLNINLDPVLEIYKQYPEYFRSVLQTVSLAVPAGIDGLSVTLNKALSDGYGMEQLKLIRLNCDVHFILRVPADEKYLKEAITLKPDMIIFYEKTEDERAVTPLEEIEQNELENILMNLQANNIPAGIFVKPETGLLKEINKTTLDWIEIDVSEYTGADNSNDEIEALEKIVHFHSMAVKMGFGTSLSGSVKKAHLAELSKIDLVNEIILGFDFWDKVIKNGMEKTVNTLWRYLQS